MSEPTEAAYEAAARAESIRLYGGDAGPYVHIILERLRQAVDAVWPLAEAEGRRQAAVDIRAEIVAGVRLPPDLAGDGDRPRASALAEWAARIAEGAARPPVTFMHPCGWSQVSPIPHLCPQCGKPGMWS